MIRAAWVCCFALAIVPRSARADDLEDGIQAVEAGDYDNIKKKLGDREISFNSATADESKFVVATYSDVDPGTVWLYDRKTKNLTTLYQAREKLDRNALSPMKAIRYKSSDGLEIPALVVASAFQTRMVSVVTSSNVHEHASGIVAARAPILPPCPLWICVSTLK
jgi:hypothetical protein